MLVNPRQEFSGFSKSAATRYPPLGLAYIAALTPDNWDVRIVDEQFDDDSFEDCDLVGIAVMTCQAPRAYEIARTYQKKGIPVVMGGIHASMKHQEALQYCDSVVIGEADELWGQVIEDFEAGRLQPTYESEGEVDLTRLVQPAHHLLDKRYAWGVVFTTRGCPMQCEFCSVSQFNGFRYRERPIEPIIEELKTINQKLIFFADDNIAGRTARSAERFIQLCKRMIAEKVNKLWIGQTSINVAENEEALYWARESGCTGLLIGVESVSPDVLSSMNKRVNIDHVQRGEFVKKIQSHGIAVLTSFILGNDDDTPETFDSVYQYASAVKMDLPIVTFLVPYPGTALETRLVSQQRLGRRNLPADWGFYNIGDRAVIEPLAMTKREINVQMKRLAHKLYSLWSILRRSASALLRWRSLTRAVIVFRLNLSLRAAHFNATYFLDKQLR